MTARGALKGNENSSIITLGWYTFKNIQTRSFSLINLASITRSFSTCGRLFTFGRGSGSFAALPRDTSRLFSFTSSLIPPPSSNADDVDCPHSSTFSAFAFVSACSLSNSLCISWAALRFADVHRGINTECFPFDVFNFVFFSDSHAYTNHVSLPPCPL